MMVRQNKWRACRYGLDAQLVDPTSRRPSPARQVVRSLVADLTPTADALECRAYLDSVLALIEQPTGSSRQRVAFARTGDLAEVVRQMLTLSAL
jgi:carboxylate-amine ligase